MVIVEKRAAGVSASSLSRFLNRLRKSTGLDEKVNVLITDNRKMAELNSRFRHKNAPTDVLSFPSGADDWVGDIAVSVEIARENARRLGHSLAEELKILVLHGFLHLAGYDHESDDGRMTKQESELRQELGLPVALIERARGVGRTAKPRNTKQRPRKTSK